MAKKPQAKLTPDIELALREHRKRGRPNIEIALCTAAAALALIYFLGPNVVATLMFIAAGVILGAGAWNLYEAHRIEVGLSVPKLDQPEAKRHIIALEADGFERVTYDDGEEEYIEKVVSTSAGPVHIRLGVSEESMTIARRQVLFIEQNIEQILSELHEFLVEQADTEKFSNYRTELLDLCPIAINFWSDKKPQYAEFEFRQNAALRIWSCGYDGGRFEKLGFDD